jgi:hypothetical protein
MRIACVALTALVLLAPAAQAGEKGLKGNWTVAFYERGARLTPWLLKVDPKDGKPEAELKTAEKVPPSELKNFRLKGKMLTFTISLRGSPFDFEFLVPKGAPKTLMGSMQVGPGQIVAARLEATKDDSPTFNPPKALPKFSFDDAKALVAKAGENPLAFDAATVLFREAKENKATAEEVKGWAESLARAAENYGPRWQQHALLRVGAALAAPGDYPAAAVEIARRAVKANQKGNAESRIRALTLLETALDKAGKKEELKAVRAQIEELEPQGHKEALADLPFQPKPAPGGKGTRAVLVELFTGAMCPPCVAADMAFDGLEKTYKPRDVVLLQYHLHIPGPDALTNPDTQARQKFYGEEVEGTPSIFFNGKPEAGGGGARKDAKAKYEQYVKVVTRLLDEKANAQIKAQAVRKGDKINITAEVSGLKDPGEKVKLRLALVQEWVRYPGGNGLVYHSRVVRALPGGADGFALPKDSGKHKASVDLGELRKSLKEYLDGVRGLPTKSLPLRFGELSVVAFVQNDETREVLQAIEVPIKE